MDHTVSSEQPTGVLIIMPVLNEANNIEPLLDSIDRELAGLPYIVCLIDDGSTDGTVEIIGKRMAGPSHHLHLIQRVRTHRGSQRGSALLDGMRWGLDNTDHTVFVEMDGDGSHRPEELRTGIEIVASKQADIAIASKFVPGSEVINRTAGRRVVSWICSIAVRRVIDARVIDYSNGYRFYNRAAAALGASYTFRYGSPIYLTELLALWMWSGLRVREFPTLYVGRYEGLSKLRLTDLAKAGLAIFEVASRYHLTGFGSLRRGQALSPQTVPWPARTEMITRED